MRIPESLTALVDDGIIDEVLRPLMSGKEAQVYLVLSGGRESVAKVYKDAQRRTFQNRAEYTEGRKVRNTRDQRAMQKRTRHGRAQDEAAWRTTEVDMIYRLRSAGVRVPEPYHFIDGVLVMELVTDADGQPAPRLGELLLEREEAQRVFDQLLAEVVRMLCAGVVHGDLSDFNVLMAEDGPVIIDFPQAVDAASNQNARRLLTRDVDNLHRHLAKHVPGYVARPYAQEMWQLYERNALTPDTRLRGVFRGHVGRVQTEAVLGLIGDAARDERRRREALGLSMRGAPPTERRERPSDQRGERPNRELGSREAPVVRRGVEPRSSAQPGERRPPQVSAAPNAQQQFQRAPGTGETSQGEAAKRRRRRRRRKGGPKPASS
jgi:RIO kinase 1